MLKFPLPSEKILPNEIKLEKTPHYHQKDDTCRRIVGSLVGLAVSDALGASVEFRPRQYLLANPVRKMEGGGTWGLDAGKWTDDTSMALCLASSLISEYGYNAYDQMVRYKWWFKYGYLSSTGNCFDIGKATRQSIIDFSNRQKSLQISYRCRNEYEVDTLSADSVERLKTFQIDCGDKESAGNGALMRLAPIPLFYFNRPIIAVDYAGRSATLTHANRKAIDACRYYAALIIGALHGLDKNQLLDRKFYSTYRAWFGEESLHEDIQSIAEGSFKKKGGYDDGIRGKGYVVNALEAALWAFWSDEGSFEKGALAAVNLGDDTDTTAAIYGQLAGAFYGYENIPKAWIEKLYAHDLIVCMAEWLHFQGQQHASKTNYQNSEEQKQQHNLSASNTSPTDPSNTSEINRKSHQNVPLRKQFSTSDPPKPKPITDRTLSLDSNTDAPTNRTPSLRDANARTPILKPAERDDSQGEFSAISEAYPFYRDQSSRDSYPD